MKGVVFKTFESFVEENWTDVLADKTLNLESLSTGGAYTSVGDYPPSDMLTMAGFVAAETGMAVSDLVREFGIYLLHVLAKAHAEILTHFSSCIDMLAGIETVIHRDVRKIYSNAQLPQFDVSNRKGDESLTLVYRSARPFADLAEGLIIGAFEHYRVKPISSLKRYDITNDGTHTQFEILIRHDAGQNTA